jgi:hypothetical protein
VTTPAILWAPGFDSPAAWETKRVVVAAIAGLIASDSPEVANANTRMP